MPSVSNHQLEVVILVDARADIRVVVDEFSLGNFSIAHVCVPLCDEFVEDVIFGHLTALELRVEAHIVLLYNVGKINDSATIAVELLEGQLNQTKAALVKLSTEASKELVVVDLTVFVSIKELEDAFKFLRAKLVTVLNKTPLEIIAVQLFVTVVVHAAEDHPKATNSVCASCL